MIRNNIELAKNLFHLVTKEEELQAVSNNLSITTFRYIPKDLLEDSIAKESYLNTLNKELLNSLQAGGKVFLSNAVIDQKYCLRVCIVNFRTSYDDLKTLIEIVLNEGKRLDAQLQIQSRIKEN